MSSKRSNQTGNRHLGDVTNMGWGGSAASQDTPESVSENKPFSFAAAVAKGTPSHGPVTSSSKGPSGVDANTSASALKQAKAINSGSNFSAVSPTSSSAASGGNTEGGDKASFANKAKARFGSGLAANSNWISATNDSTGQSEGQSSNPQSGNTEESEEPNGSGTLNSRQVPSWGHNRPYNNQTHKQESGHTNNSRYNSDFHRNKRDGQPPMFRRGSNYDSHSSQPQQFVASSGRQNNFFASQQRANYNANGASATSGVSGALPAHRAVGHLNSSAFEQINYTNAEKNALIEANDRPNLSSVREVDSDGSVPASSGEEDDTTVWIPRAADDGKHYLRYSWGLWYLQRGANRSKAFDYEEALARMAEFSTVEDFWSLFSRLKPIANLNQNCELHIFTNGTRPMWEDHPTGGKWILRLRKGLVRRLWENLVLVLIGGGFSLEAMNVEYDREHGEDLDTDECPEVYGIVLAVRQGEDYIAIWNKSAQQQSINSAIRDTIRRTLGLPESTVLEYKPHQQALKAL